MSAEAIVCSACAICFFPISLPVICLEHCIQCEKAWSGITPTYPYPVKACCKNGSFLPCCPYAQHTQQVQGTQNSSEKDYLSQKVMTSPPRTPTKINFNIYSKF